MSIQYFNYLNNHLKRPSNTISQRPSYVYCRQHIKIFLEGKSMLGRAVLAQVKLAGPRAGLTCRAA